MNSRFNPTPEEIEATEKHKRECYERWRVDAIKRGVAWLHKQRKADISHNLSKLENRLGKPGRKLFEDIKRQYFDERAPIMERNAERRRRYAKQQSEFSFSDSKKRGHYEQP